MLDEGSSYNFIARNQVSNSGIVGININGLIDEYDTWNSHDNVVINNKVTDSAEYGIALSGLSSDNLVKRNRVFGSGEYDLCEIDLTGTGNVWENNKYDSFGIVVTSP